VSLNNAVIALLFALSGWSIQPAFAAEVCPLRDRQPLHFVDVFDGPPAELATLMPDKAEKLSGYWLLDYVYDAGRFVVVRCKYADKQTLDVKLSNRVHRCDYTIDAKKTLKVYCK
jgi:hypothetical protein